MSSIQENSSVLHDKRKRFFRSGSLQKIKCSAYHSIQLAGSIFSKESLMQLFELLIMKSRNILQKALIFLSLPAFKMCCAVVLFWIDAFTKYSGINFVFEKKIVTSANVEPEKTYILRVQKKRHTQTAQSETAKPKVTFSAEPELAFSQREDKAQNNTDVRPIAEIEKTVEITKITEVTKVTEATERTEVESNSSDTNDVQSRLMLKTSSLDSESELGSNHSISSRQNYGLVVIVYGCATLVYIQLMFLAMFLNTTSTPPGLLFLVSSLAYIGYIVFQICFVKAKSKEDTSSAALPATKVPNKKTEKSNSLKQSRFSRSTSRLFLYFSNRTLSKIKLL